MDSRRALGSWLSGPRDARDPDDAASPMRKPAGHRGERLGLPADGPGALAGFGRRLVALCLDWAACLLVSRLLFPHLVYGSSAASGATLGVFAVEVTLLTWLGGATFGQRLARVRVVGLTRRLGLGGAALRTLLLVVVIPPLVTDRDGRGLHDKAVGSAAVRA